MPINVLAIVCYLRKHALHSLDFFLLSIELIKNDDKYCHPL